MLILTLWSVLDPWKWEREWVSKVPAESYGQCTSKNFWLFFAPLVALLVTAELLTAVFAWKTADVPTDFADSRTALYALCAHFQAFCIGVPILAVLGESSVDATFVSRVVLIFIFSVSSVAVVVYPKIYQAFQLRRRPELRISSRVNVTGISAPVHESKKFSGSSKTLKQEPVPDLCNPEGIESV